MSRLLRGELIKTVTTRTVLGFAVGTVAFAALNALVVAAWSGTLDEVAEKEEALSAMPVLLLLWGWSARPVSTGTGRPHRRHWWAAVAAGSCCRRELPLTR